MTIFGLAETQTQKRFVVDALQRVRTTVAVAQGLASLGREIDLDGLEGATGVLCAQVLDLSPDEATGMRQALDDLNTRISMLTNTLAKQAS